jgi:hypothetical protein
MTDRDRFLDIPDPLSKSQTTPPPMPPLPARKSPTRAERKRSLTLVVGAAVVYQIVWLALVEHRADLASSSTSLLMLGVVAPLALAAMTASAALKRGAHGLGASVSGLGAAVVAAPVLFALSALVIASRMTDETAPFWDRAVRCIAVTCALTAPPMTMLTLVFRRAFVAAAAWRSAALGVACGALGAATMTLACSHGEALHVIVAHGSMMIVGGGLGALIGRTLTRA